MKRWSGLLCLMVLGISLLAGCGDRTEIEKRAHVVVAGLDKGPEQFLEVTFQVANPQVGSTERGQAEKEPPSDTVTFTAVDIPSAKELANSVITRKLSFTHLQTIVVGEELARSGLFHTFYSSAMTDPEIRREVNIIVSKEKASEFIHANKPKLETRPHKYYSFMQQRWKETGFVPLSTSNRYFQRVSGELYLAIYATTLRDERRLSKILGRYIAGQVPQKSGDPVQIIGAAVFKNGKMIDVLTGSETRTALFLRKEESTHSIITSFPDPKDENYNVTVRLLKNKPTKIRVNVKADPAEITAEIDVKVQIFSVPSLHDYILSLDNQKLLKQAVEDMLNTESMKLVKKTQERYRSDPFEWHLEARRHFWTLQEYEQYDWNKQFEQAKVTVKYNAVIENFGKQFKPVSKNEMLSS